jgi:site-specific recombinase XerD
MTSLFGTDTDKGEAMLDDYFKRAEILRRHRAGFFGAYLDAYTSAAMEHGFQPDTVRYHCYVFRLFGHWVERRGLSIDELDDGVIGEFWRKRRHVPRLRSSGTKPLRRLMAQLRAQGVVPEQPAPKRTDAAALAYHFGEYLEHRRALMPATVRRAVDVVQQFLEGRFGRGPLQLHALGETDVTRFVLGTADRVAPRTHQTNMSYLRSFFRFLLEQGTVDVDLSGVVPAVARWRLAGVPKYLAREQVEQVLASCNRDTPTGRRDLAILLLLSRLGLRACEVARIALDDIRWRTGELIVRGKGSTIEALPLVSEVGEALAAYIKKDRPKCETRRVFTRMRAPITPIARRGTVTTIVRCAITRAGLDVPARGAHVLRHSLATNMLRDGASMSEIGIVLRHRSPATTEIYAKVDITSLRRLAQPWPVGGKSLDDYLNVRRALGFKLEETERCLRRFVDFLEAEGAKHITTELALRWARRPANGDPFTWAQRLSRIRLFAAWYCARDPHTEVPDAGLLAIWCDESRPSFSARGRSPTSSARPRNCIPVAVCVATRSRRCLACSPSRDCVSARPSRSTATTSTCIKANSPSATRNSARRGWSR